MRIDHDASAAPELLCADHPDAGKPRLSADPDADVATKPRTATQKPPLYKVFILNDDYTPMEFVVHVLETFFRKSRDEATRIMFHVHRHGLGLCGAYPFDVAETKVSLVLTAARSAQHPLQCRLERE